MKRKSEYFLKDIIDAINNIEDYVTNLSLDDFKNEKMRVDAVTRNFTILGEAVSQLPPEIIEKHLSVPWIEVKNFRNVIVHKYHILDLDIMWDIIENKLNPLKEQITKILKEE